MISPGLLYFKGGADFYIYKFHNTLFMNENSLVVC